MKLREIIITAAALLLCSYQAEADIVTEFGMGWKTPNSSLVLQPECTQVRPVGEIVDSPDSRYFGRRFASCGGNNPAFIGWPIAWQTEGFGKYGAFTGRVGWFHYSNWFDGGNVVSAFGGDRHETHMDLIAGTITFNWTRWKDGRKNRRGR